jgi:hypothetical protein
MEKQPLDERSQTMRHLLIFLSLLLTLACLPTVGVTSVSSTPVEPSSGPTPTPLEPAPSRPDAYRATFEIRFAGTYTWVYRLESRTDGSADGGATAYDLHIEGVDASQNPGDVRVVLEGDEVKMRGPATDDACVQFPSDLDLGQSFLSPDDLMPHQEIEPALRPTGTETIAEREAVHYALRQPSLADWQDVEIDIWKDATSGATLRYDLRAQGTDPLFDAGEGTLSGQFVVQDLGPQAIEPITGCEIDLPLPPDAERLVRMPGLVAFESAATPDEIVAFYQAALAESGWEPIAEPETGVDAVLLGYHRDGEMLNVNVETRETGTYVELLQDEE